MTRNLAPLLLDVIIVGAGFAGLSAAYTLAKSGHRVRVLDRYPHFGSIKTSGLKITPNFAQMLREWGLGDALKAISNPANQASFIFMDTGDQISSVTWTNVFLDPTQDMLLAPYEDVLKLVYDLAVKSGAKVIYNSVVTQYESNDRPSVTLADGNKLYADLIVNAGGLGSLRKADEGARTRDDWDITGMSVYSATVPAATMRRDPVLRELLESVQWSLWMGTYRSASVYPIRNGKDYVVDIFWPDEGTRQSSTKTESQWTDCKPETLILEDGIDARFRTLLKMIPSFTRVQYVTRKYPVTEWIDDSGRIIDIGDAAHPLLPTTLSTPALAIEDAAVLGYLLSHIRTKSSLPRLLSALQEIQEPRYATLRAFEHKYAIWLSPNQAERRDRVNRFREREMAEQSLDEDMLRHQWEDLASVFAYNALEAAQNWWSEWGRIVLIGDAEAVNEREELKMDLTGKMVE